MIVGARVVFGFDFRSERSPKHKFEHVRPVTKRNVPDPPALKEGERDEGLAERVADAIARGASDGTLLHVEVRDRDGNVEHLMPGLLRKCSISTDEPQVVDDRVRWEQIDRYR